MPINKGDQMAKKKLKTPEDIIEAIREKQSEIDDLIYDLEDQISDISSVEDEDEDIDEMDEE
jgi:peptidoglycan hydrolase CwlO-like protein